MNRLQVIEQLCALLSDASRIIQAQAALLSEHDIHTEDEALESAERRFLEATKEWR